MIELITDKKYYYELENILRLFYPFEKIVPEAPAADRRVTAAAREERTGDYTLSLELSGGGLSDRRTAAAAAGRLCGFDRRELGLARLLYEALAGLTGYRPPWGVLTGVRPAKLFRRLSLSEGESAARRFFAEDLLVLPEKAALCAAVSRSEGEIIALSRPESYSLYIAIPFCPTRCSYCSFVSHSVEKSAALVPEYVDLLCREIADAAERVAPYNLRLETVYIGGGTPTTLTAEQLRRVMKAVADAFPLDGIHEYTVEAGRPDTITREKLAAILDGGATRVSINPQTMQDAVLREIGRRHTADDVRTAFALARRAGFTNINMDLIAGLPLDTPEGFVATVEEILALDPESVTIHTLAMKRSSRLTVGGERALLSAGGAVTRMLSDGRRLLEARGILPYYMYRQSKTVGGQENVGYAKPGFEGLYNVYIMDETHTILACGASAVTKLKAPFSEGEKIERIFNYKYPYEYNKRFDEILMRKRQVNDFYEQYYRNV
ncbi:MAG: coproporphyrinogen dehydrogenase HemZ [Candidatus Howiella sp.]|jgi:oxygen-independent coproporphyrinogen-3 oxidase